MRFKKIVKLFDSGNVCVVGLRGKGKDMLMSNVVARRKLPYVSNVDYKCKGSFFKRFNPLDYDTGNTFKNFIHGNINAYSYPHEDGTDIYISDAGVYFPSQYCSDLNKHYGGLVSFMSLSRHLGNCNVHVNAQSLNRIYDKIREQSEIFILCNKCIVFLGFVLQLITIYELHDSCVKRVPPFSMKRPLLNKDRQQQYEIAYNNYRCSYGKIERHILFYRNKSKYDTRIFKTMLSDAEINSQRMRDEVYNQVRAELLAEIDERIKSTSNVKSTSEEVNDIDLPPIPEDID